MTVAAILEEIAFWAAARSDVVGIALVGSHARGTSRPDSDIDLVVLSDAPLGLLNGEWVSVFGEVESSVMEDYGELKSLRVFYRNGPEVEFGVASRAWAQTPLSSGTWGVLAGGVRALYDPEGVFGMAKAAADAELPS